VRAFLRKQLRRQWQLVRFLFEQWAQPVDPAPVVLTCAGKRDGGGAQWHAVLSVLALARSFGLPFRFSPFLAIEHGPSSDLSWLQAWDALLDLQACGIASCGHDTPSLACSDPLTLLRGRRRGALPVGALLQLEHAHAFTNLFPAHLASLRPLLRQAYRPQHLTPEAPLPLAHTLVVHVRRGDVQASGPHSHRFTSATAIAARCRQLQTRFPQLHHVLLLSASADPDLLKLGREGFLLDVEHDVFTHLHWMSQAAGLVMARSSLSYLSAMLNPNLVFYERFEHPPLSGWIRLPK
jgi:hypothetical protein